MDSLRVASFGLEPFSAKADLNLNIEEIFNIPLSLVPTGWLPFDLG